ncbi:MAG: hypothetical protein JSR99_09880 [Proteobacteria bacterium]|nr:hypothetical protein [Pseudomonadota bacterium]
MNRLPHIQAAIASFNEYLSIAPRAFNEGHFAYLVFRGNNRTQLLCSHLTLDPLTTAERPRVIESSSFFGFSGPLSSLATNPNELIELLLAGSLPGPDGRRWTLTRDSESFSGTPNFGFGLRPPSSGIRATHRNTIELVGHAFSTPYVLTEEDQWALRAAPVPYRDLADLMSDLKLLPGPQFRAVAFPVLEILTASRIEGDLAKIRVRVAQQVAAERITVGLLVTDKGTCIDRRRISAADFSWTQAKGSSEHNIGEISVRVPGASLVQCFATIDTKCVHELSFVDPNALPNPLKEVLEVFDKGFETAKALLHQDPNKGNTTGQEASVAALFWALGFSTIMLGRAEAPDIIALSHDGHFLAIECTLSSLQNKERKPQKLLDRTKKIRAALDRNNASNSVCLPVMVTSRSLESVMDEKDDCESKGILVLTIEDLRTYIDLMPAHPRSDLRFSEMAQRITDAVQKAEAKDRKAKELVRSVDELKKNFEGLASGNRGQTRLDS